MYTCEGKWYLVINWDPPFFFFFYVGHTDPFYLVKTIRGFVGEEKALESHGANITESRLTARRRQHHVKHVIYGTNASKHVKLKSTPWPEALP